MNDFEAWQYLLTEWRGVQRVKHLNQELYDQLGGSILYLLNYAEKNDIALSNKEGLCQMLDKAHNLMTSIDSPTHLNNQKKQPDNEQSKK